jgi:hypothetical protein
MVELAGKALQEAIVGANLDRQCALTGIREKPLKRQILGDLLCSAKTREARGRKNNCIVLFGPGLAQSCVYVSAEWDDEDVWP